MTLVTIRLGERAEIVRPAAPPSAWRRRLPLVGLSTTTAVALVLAVFAPGTAPPVPRAPDPALVEAIAALRSAGDEIAALRTARDDALATVAARDAPRAPTSPDPVLLDELAALRDALEDALARATAAEAALAAIETRLATVAPDPPISEVTDADPPDAPAPAVAERAAEPFVEPGVLKAALTAAEARADWLAAALAHEVAYRNTVEATASLDRSRHLTTMEAVVADAADRQLALSSATEDLARLLEASVDERLSPVRQLLAAVRLEGSALSRTLAAAPGAGGPLVPVPAGAEDLPHRLPAAAALRLRAAMDGAQTLRTLCRLADRIPAGPPVAATGQSGGFGRRIDPVTHQPAFHTGVDLNAPVGTPVVVPAPGTVAEVTRHPEYGLMVDVDHGYGLVTRYAHLSSALVRKGAPVAAGNPVGLVGRTGRTTGDHLHYEVVMAGRAVDPSPFLTARRHVCEAL